MTITFSKNICLIFFCVRLYVCLCANDIPKSCKFRFKSGQNSKCKLRFELVTYYLNRGTAVGTASSRALTREKRVHISASIILSKQLGTASGRLACECSLKRIIGAEIPALFSLVSALLSAVSRGNLTYIFYRN